MYVIMHLLEIRIFFQVFNNAVTLILIYAIKDKGIP